MKSVVTAPAVPPPTALTAAAWAFAALAPVTGTSAFSCAAVPCSGIAPGAPGAAADGGDGLGPAALAAVVPRVAATPTATPASIEPATAPATRSRFGFSANDIRVPPQRCLPAGRWRQFVQRGLGFHGETLRVGGARRRDSRTFREGRVTLSPPAQGCHRLTLAMHLHPEHAEQHFTAGDMVRDVVVGMSDGLTVPFALAAGISGAIAQSHLVVTAGLAEIAAGSIAMGLGGYLAGRSEAEHYASERRREETEIKAVPDVEAREITQIFEAYGLTEDESAPVVAALQKRPGPWVDF